MKTLAFAAVTFFPAVFGWTDKCVMCRMFVMLIEMLILLPVMYMIANRWDHSKRFNAAGHAQLDCDGTSQPASCCICKSIVFEVETQLNNTQNDYDMDVVFRISEEKKRIKYSRSEVRILEVLDDVCKQVPLNFPSSNNVATRMLSAAVRIMQHVDSDPVWLWFLIRKSPCNDFVGEYEDELTRIFFDDFTPAKERMCVGILQGRQCRNVFPVDQDTYFNMCCWKVCPQPDTTSKFEEL
ncbi:hypothetical protein DD238_000331 [Peronospora effusa]|uniref:Saposin B-type domain-containing protein n=1 Tax=Peronospora effusa TaxID=542832 RepID=A0A3M6VM96_9STRA|nr:hypothetical protein DD238_000331 [Peronospora effusa]